MEDVSIVTTHLILATKNQGIGFYWINFLDSNQSKAGLNLPKDKTV